MDEFSCRKTAGGLSFSRKRSGLAVRDSSTDKGQTTPICSRVGCGSRMSSIQDNRTGVDQPKTTKHHLYLSRNGKEATGSSSRTPASPVPMKYSNPSKMLPNARDRLSSRARTNVSRASTSNEAISSASLLCSRRGKEAIRHGNRDSRTGISSSKYNLKSLKCNVLNDVDPSSTSMSASSSSSLYSSSELILGRKKRTVRRRRIGEAESSLPATGKKLGRLQIDERRNNDSHHAICISDSTRRSNLSSTRSEGVTTDTTRRSTTTVRFNESENQRRRQRTDTSSLIPLLPQQGITLDTDASIYEFLYPFRSTNLNGRISNSSSEMPSNASLAPFGVGFRSSSMSREATRQNNLSGIAEMLLAMDTIDQDDDLTHLTYEQLRVLERDLASHDRHRDMRLDIDNMSYEELLELGDRMGTVSTALSEEELTKCILRSIYEAANDGGAGSADGGDDIKCSICQEEYEEGNEVGRLVCQHRYHVDCIQRWLKMKNWCPICKASAASSPLASSPS